jgi:hypothetical protein
MGAYYGYDSFLEDDITRNNVNLLLSVDTSDSDFKRPEKYLMTDVLELADT